MAKPSGRNRFQFLLIISIFLEVRRHDLPTSAHFMLASTGPHTVEAKSTHRLRAGASLFSGLLLLCVACIDPYTTDLLSIDYGILVIDGYFVPNDTTRIRLTRTVTIDNPGSASAEPAAVVRIESDNGFSTTLTTRDAQWYELPPIAVDYQAQYRLTVRTSDGREYVSKMVPLAPRTSVDSVVVHEQPDGEDVTFSVFAHDPANASWYYSYQFDETWEYIAKDYSVYEYRNGELVARKTAADIYNCWQTMHSTDILVNTTARLSADVVYDFPIAKMRQSDRRLYFAYSINARQYVLTADAYSYWSIMKKNSEQLGSLSDPLPAQPVGNYACTNDPARPVVGFFTASDVSTQRLLVKREQLKGPTELYQSDGYENCPREIVLLADMSEAYLNSRKLLINNRAFDPVTFELIGYSVLPEFCLDCRLRGGTTQRPPYWK